MGVTVLRPRQIGGTYKAPIFLVDGNPGSPEDGENDFQSDSLIGATEMNFIIVNKIPEYIGDDYTFDSGTGTLSRTNVYVDGDKIIVPHKSFI